MISHLLAITIAYGLDRMLGDPKGMPHPVVGMGKVISGLERRLNIGMKRKRNGFVMLVIVIGLFFLVTYLLVALIERWNPYVAVGIEGILIWTTIAEKGLHQAAEGVYQPLKKGDLFQARQQVSYIVGRDTEHLQEEGIVRATVETVAENISDGVTAPLFYALVGGAPLAIVYRAVNTCDSMVGYKNERFLSFGFASAKADDVLNLIASRLTAFIMISCSNYSFSEKRMMLKQLPQEAKKHPSPNSGWGEAAAALLLGVQLGGTNYYFGEKSERPTIGTAVKSPVAEHIRATNELLSRTVLFWLILLWIGGSSLEMAFAWSKSP